MRTVVFPRTGLILRRFACLAVACGVPLAFGAGAQAQNSYSTSNASYQYSYNAQNGSSNSQSQYGSSNYGNQYQRRGTPRYTGTSWTDHLVLEGGGGVTPPVGNTQNFANSGYNILLGIGAKFNDRLSLLAEWNFNRLGVPSTLANVIAGTPGGNEHLWSVNLNPKFNFVRAGRMNLYAIGGGGFSRALINFTTPVLVPCYYGYYYGFGYPGACTGNVTVYHTSTNQGNWDIGGGAEWHVSPYERGKIFLEARYEKYLTPNRGLPPGRNAAIVPVTLGYRW
jgi:hypothetical protein